MHEKLLHFDEKTLMLHKKKFHVKKTGFCCTKKVSCKKKNRFLLHKKKFQVQKSYYFFPERRAVQNHKIDLKTYDATTWLTNSYNIHVVQYFTSKGNQITKFGQVMDYNKINVFFRNHAGNQAGRLFPDQFYEVKGNGLQFSFNIFRQSSTQHRVKTNCIKLQTIDPEIYSILMFQKRVCEQFLHHILYMIFQEKFFTCY